MNSFGSTFRISLFGESHGTLIGCTLDGLPAGFAPDTDMIRAELLRRRPRGSTESTKRRESDEFEIVSGLYGGVCTGAPLTALFRNTDVRSEAYSERIARPSHADYTAYVKYGGFNDPRGGGMFSGRLTAPPVFAGALAKQLLFERGVRILSHIYRIGSASDEPFDPLLTIETMPFLDPFFPLVNEDLRKDIERLFSEAASKGTSLGGTVECAVLGLPVGVGEPFFDGVESVLSHILFSIPAVHGVEFGLGFGFSEADGLTVNDRLLPNGRTDTNFSGGANGGITNGMPLVFRACFRPVPTVRGEQTAVNIETGAEVRFTGGDRHDICILPRGCVVVESAAAIALVDLMLRAR